METKPLDARDFQNDALAHVILLEAALIEFRGHFLRRDAAKMNDALVVFHERCVGFFDAIETALAVDAVDPVAASDHDPTTRV
jgi:hypothetical protein